MPSPALVKAALINSAVELDQANAEAWVYLGVALRMDKKEDEARKAFNKALEINPNRFWVRELLVKKP